MYHIFLHLSPQIIYTCITCQQWLDRSEFHHPKPNSSLVLTLHYCDQIAIINATLRLQRVTLNIAAAAATDDDNAVLTDINWIGIGSDHRRHRCRAGTNFCSAGVVDRAAA